MRPLRRLMTKLTAPASVANVEELNGDISIDPVTVKDLELALKCLFFCVEQIIAAHTFLCSCSTNLQRHYDSKVHGLERTIRKWHFRIISNTNDTVLTGIGGGNRQSIEKRGPSGLRVSDFLFATWSHMTFKVVATAALSALIVDLSLTIAALSGGSWSTTSSSVQFGTFGSSKSTVCFSPVLAPLTHTISGMVLQRLALNSSDVTSAPHTLKRPLIPLRIHRDTSEIYESPE